MTLRDALDRTLLLMRDEIDEGAPDEMLIEALTGTTIALIADEANLASHSAQSAFVTAALLMARSAHTVTLLAPNVRFAGAQPPLTGALLIDSLMDAGTNLLPGISFQNTAIDQVDVAITFGSSPVTVSAGRIVRINATTWCGMLCSSDDLTPWRAARWHMGGLAAGALAATEVFKIAMHKLAPHFRNPNRLTGVFAPSEGVTFALAPEDTATCGNLGNFDCVSGGAITNALLFALLRIPGVSGNARVIEPETSDLSNLNRYAMLLRSANGAFKATDLAELAKGLIEIEPVKAWFDAELMSKLGSFAPCVLVGVDDIPSRWAVQAQTPAWLAIGATTHWSAMASFHNGKNGCARCLHNEDDLDTARIPTVAFVSFWAGLLTATYFLRHLGGGSVDRKQQIYLTPFRPENPMRSPVQVRPGCPTCRVRNVAA